MSNSKEATCDEEKTKITVNAVLRHCAMNVLTRDMPMQVEVELFKQIGDSAQAASMMATAQSYGALAEFLLNPLFGSLSETFGRKAFLNTLCTWSLFGNVILANNPFAKIGSIPFVVINRAITGLLSSQAGSAMGLNALSDVSSGSQLGVNVAAMSGAFGAGMVVGPLLGNKAYQAGGFKLVYRVRILLALSHLIHNLTTIPETLQIYKPFSLNGVNPFGFLKLFINPDVTLLSRLARALLSCTSEQKNLISMKMLWLKDGLNFSFNEVQNTTTAYSVCIVASGQFLAKAMIQAVGAKNFSDLAAALNVLAYGLWANASSRFAYWLGLLLHIPGVNGTGASMVKADMMARAAELGIGKGEMNAYYSNLRAGLVMVVPKMLAAAYTAGLPTGRTGQAWYILAIASALSAALRA